MKIKHRDANFFPELIILIVQCICTFLCLVLVTLGIIENNIFFTGVFIGVTLANIYVVYLQARVVIDIHDKIYSEYTEWRLR